jgi:hypothetical protein
MSGIKDLKPAYGKFKQGYYQPQFPDKYHGKMPIIYRSNWERKFCAWLDLTPEILEWSSESISIKYFYEPDQSMHTYYPDFYFMKKNQDGSISKYLVEVKPTKFLQRPSEPKRKTPNALKNYRMACEQFAKNYYKSIAAKEWCTRNGYKYVYLTENSNLF